MPDIVFKGKESVDNRPLTVPCPVFERNWHGSLNAKPLNQAC